MCKVWFLEFGDFGFWGFWILDFGFWGFWTLDFGFWGSWILDFGLGILDGHLVTKIWMLHKKRSCARRPGSADCVQVHLYFESPAMKDSLRGSPMQAWGSCVLPKQIGQEGRTPLGEPTFAWQFTNSRFV